MDDRKDKLPVKGSTGKQVETTFDPRELKSNLNVDPDKLRIGSAQLFVQATEQTRMAICVSDPHQPDCPIVYANKAFTELTGYPLEDLIGHNCRFLQGEETDPDAVERIRAVIDDQQYDVVDILNYKKDGTAFWNAVHIGPIYDEDGKLAYYYGSQWDITELIGERERNAQAERIASELQHRTDNLFAVMSAIVRMSARNVTDTKELTTKITERIGALATAHRVSIDTSDGAKADMEVGVLVDEIVKPYRTTNEHRFHTSGEKIRLARKMVTPLGLTLHELSTNALKYGALGISEGEVHIDWRQEDGDLFLDWRENGRGKDRNVVHPNGVQGGSGTRIMQGVLDGIGGTFESEITDEGFYASIRLPMTEYASNYA